MNKDIIEYIAKYSKVTTISHLRMLERSTRYIKSHRADEKKRLADSLSRNVYKVIPLIDILNSPSLEFSRDWDITNTDYPIFSNRTPIPIGIHTSVDMHGRHFIFIKVQGKKTVVLFKKWDSEFSYWLLLCLNEKNEHEHILNIDEALDVKKWEYYAEM